MKEEKQKGLKFRIAECARLDETSARLGLPNGPERKEQGLVL
jgi:hypothetical protein